MMSTAVPIVQGSELHEPDDEYCTADPIVQGSELHEPDEEYSLLLYMDLSSMSLMMSTASYCTGI